MEATCHDDARTATTRPAFRLPRLASKQRASPLSGPPLSPSSAHNKRLASGQRWRFTHQAAPTVLITGFAGNDQGVTEYICETRFGDGRPSIVRHRFSDFLRLHASIGAGQQFPVAKTLFVTKEVKQQRVLQLSAYLSDAISQRVTEWAEAVSQGESASWSLVLSDALHDFLDAKELDRARLESLRGSPPTTGGMDAAQDAAIPVLELEPARTD